MVFRQIPPFMGPTNVTPPIIHPTQNFVNHTFSTTIVPHIHPFHTTTVNHHNFQHKHYCTQSQSADCCVTQQHFNCCGPGMGPGAVPGFGMGPGVGPGFGMGPGVGPGFGPGFR
ncbi:CotD family spore coat protein [Pseudoneobacillus sp. C159]